MANRPFLQHLQEELTYEYISDLIEKVFKNDISGECVMHQPPVAPKGGEVYIFVALESLHKNDYSRDQYRWISRGNNKQRKWFIEMQLYKA